MDTSILRMLRAHPLARELSAEDLEYLTGHARTIGYLRDAFIFHESQPRRFWGMVLKGRVALLKGPRGCSSRSSHIRAMLERSIGIVAALVPYIGYDRATAVAREALETDRGVYELVLEKQWLSRAELDEILSPDTMTKPRVMPRR